MSKIKLEIEMEELSYRATLEYKKLSCINDNDLTEMILNAKPVKEYDDCISRQATLNKAFEIKTGENTSAMVVYAEDIRKELPVLPKREQGEWISVRWIPVSEKLPEDGQRVLITCDGLIGFVKQATYDEMRGYFYDNTAKAIDYDEVIAWMPLPAPYRTESEEE